MDCICHFNIIYILIPNSQNCFLTEDIVLNFNILLMINLFLQSIQLGIWTRGQYLLLLS